MARRAARASSTRTRARSGRRARCGSSTTKPPSRGGAGGARERADDRRLALRGVPEHFAAVRGHLDASASRTSSCRRSSAASTTTRARPGSSSAPRRTQLDAICGGGRYDDLVEELGGPPTPGVGFGAGIERLLLALEARAATAEPPALDVFFVVEPTARRGAVSRMAGRAAARASRRHRLRGPLAEGPADAGGASGAPRRP